MPRVTPADLALALRKIGALRLGDFTLTSGRRSGYYLDLRVVPSHPEVYRLVLDAYREMADEVGSDNFDVVAGVATSGVIMSSPLAFLVAKPMVYVRKEEKGHGTKRLVEGETPPGSRALLVDDVATSGGSLAGAVAALRESGLVVASALVLVDRQEGAGSRLAGLGVKLRGFVRVADIVPPPKEMVPKRPSTVGSLP